MAIANTKSTYITNADATPPVLSTSYLHGGIVRHSVATAEVAAADDDGSVYRFIRLPSNALIMRLEIMNDAITGATDYDLGVYQVAANGGAVVDKEVFSSDVDMTTARTLPYDAMFEDLGIETVEQRLWEMLGLSSDPSIFYDICLTANTVGSAAGTLSVRALWSL